MVNLNEAGKEPGTWRSQDRRYICQIDTFRKRWTKSAGQIYGAFSPGISGADWARENSNIGRVITGGILSQLIDVVAEQLAEAEDCVELYQKRAEKLRETLGELEQLKGLNDRDPPESDN